MASRSSEKNPIEKKGSERRVSARHPITIPIELSAGTDMAIHITADLSGKGAFFNKAIPYGVGVKVKLRIMLPGDPKPILCAGEIVNVPDRKKFGMGVHFLDLTEGDEAKIEKFAAVNSSR